MTSQRGLPIGWVTKDWWHHYGAQCNMAVAEGIIMGAQCNLQGLEPFYGVMRPLDFQEAQWCFFRAHGGGADLFGGFQGYIPILT